MECLGIAPSTCNCYLCNGTGKLNKKDCGSCRGTGKENIAVGCYRKVKWFRCTQFAGQHPYCAVCAVLESDFGQEDSYSYWKEIKE